LNAIHDSRPLESLDAPCRQSEIDGSAAFCPRMAWVRPTVIQRDVEAASGQEGG
jgi:hypothetical protein